MKRLLAVDLGGTHIRFRLLAEEGNRPGPVRVIESGGARSFEDALDQWRAQTGIHAGLDAIGVAAAGPVAGGRAQVTNLDWVLDARAIEHGCNVRRCLLVNDVAAIAWALPSLDRRDVRTLAPGSPAAGSPAPGTPALGSPAAGSPTPGTPTPDTPTPGSPTPGNPALGTPAPGTPGEGSPAPGTPAPGSPDEGTPDDGAARAVLAPGTGLGVSGLVPAASGGFVAIEGEGGHRTLAAHDAREWAIVTALARRFGHASAERALSGPGIEATWKAIATIDGKRCERDKTAAEIAADAFAGRDPMAQEAIAVFTGLLGSVAGDLALTLGARAGVFIAGGIVPGWGERFDARRFLERFRAKGRFHSWLSAIPVHVVTRPHPGLVGVEHLLEYQMACRS